MSDEGLREKIARIDENVIFLKERVTLMEGDVRGLKDRRSQQIGATSVLAIFASAATSWLLGKLGLR